MSSSNQHQSSARVTSGPPTLRPVVNTNHTSSEAVMSSSNPSSDAHCLSIHQVGSSPFDLQAGKQTTAPQVDPSPSACQPVPDRSMSPQPTNTVPWSVLHQPAVPEAISTPSFPMCGGPLTTLTTPKTRPPLDQWSSHTTVKLLIYGGHLT